MKIGLLVISVGARYHEFIKPLLSSIDRYFLKEHDVEVNLWTDSIIQYPVKHQFLIKSSAWPFPTLYRYHYFVQQSDLLAANDYLFYLDVDMLIVDDIGKNVLSSGITATLHPGYAFPEFDLFLTNRTHFPLLICPGNGTLRAAFKEEKPTPL